MAATINIQGKDYAISGYAPDGLPIIKAIATSTQDGFDADGNPKMSVEIKVPSINVGADPGKNG